VAISGVLVASGTALATAGGHASAAHEHSGLPGGVPPAATAAEPTLPTATGWPFAEAFPRTSGTGRLHDGASYWTDFVYDDHGASGFYAASPVGLVPPGGTYIYPKGPADNNGADIFRAAVGVTKAATYWRIDWNTLVDPRVPIAEWGLDTDNSRGTGGLDWVAGAGVESPGIDKAVVVSSRGVWLYDIVTHQVTDVLKAGGTLTVDRNARSFIISIPQSVLPATGTCRVRLASGVADASGRSFMPVTRNLGARPGEPNVYNVTFRSY